MGTYLVAESAFDANNRNEYKSKIKKTTPHKAVFAKIHHEPPVPQSNGISIHLRESHWCPIESKEKIFYKANDSLFGALGLSGDDAGGLAILGVMLEVIPAALAWDAASDDESILVNYAIGTSAYVGAGLLLQGLLYRSSKTRYLLSLKQCHNTNTTGLQSFVDYSMVTANPECMKRVEKAHKRRKNNVHYTCQKQSYYKRSKCHAEQRRTNEVVYAQEKKACMTRVANQFQVESHNDSLRIPPANLGILLLQEETEEIKSTSLDIQIRSSRNKKGVSHSSRNGLPSFYGGRATKKSNQLRLGRLEELRDDPLLAYGEANVSIEVSKALKGAWMCAGLQKQSGKQALSKWSLPNRTATLWELKPTCSTVVRGEFDTLCREVQKLAKQCSASVCELNKKHIQYYQLACGDNVDWQKKPYTKNDISSSREVGSRDNLHLRKSTFQHIQL